MAEKVVGCERVYFVPIETLDSESLGFGRAWNQTLAVVPADGKMDAIAVLMARQDFGREFRFRKGSVKEYEGERTIHVPVDGRIVDWREEYEFPLV